MEPASLKLTAELVELPSQLCELAAQAFDLRFEPRDALASVRARGCRARDRRSRLLVARLFDFGAARKELGVARLLPPRLARGLRAMRLPPARQGPVRRLDFPAVGA